MGSFQSRVEGFRVEEGRRGFESLGLDAGRALAKMATSLLKV